MNRLFMKDTGIKRVAKNILLCEMDFYEVFVNPVADYFYYVSFYGRNDTHLLLHEMTDDIKILEF